jgi:hypothetical protein
MQQQHHRDLAFIFWHCRHWRLWGVENFNSKYSSSYNLLWRASEEKK